MRLRKWKPNLSKGSPRSKLYNANTIYQFKESGKCLISKRILVAFQLENYHLNFLKIKLLFADLFNKLEEIRENFMIFINFYNMVQEILGKHMLH